jgi:hypothetical protein
MKQIFTLCLLACLGVANVNAQTITTYATVATPAGLVFDGSGNLYVCQYDVTGNIIKINISGVVSTFSQSTLLTPSAIGFDGTGNFYVSRAMSQTYISKINSVGAVSYYYNQTSFSGLGLTIKATGDVYVLRSNGSIFVSTPPSFPNIFASGLPSVTPSANNIAGMGFDAIGNLYVGYNSTVYKITPTGVVSTFATLSVSNINSLAIDAAGNIFLGGGFSGIYKVTPTGTVSSIAALSGLSNIYGLAFDASGNLFASAFSDNTIYKISSTALPVILVSLTATTATNKVAINWQTTNEVNTSHFAIQRSVDGTNFSEIGKVAAKGDGSYSYADDLSTITHEQSPIYYRLQMVDKDGSFTYSKVVAVTLVDNRKMLVLFPNPVKDNLFIQFTSTKAEKLTLQVTDLQGRILQQEDTQIGVGNVSLSVNTSVLAKGSYVLLVKCSSGVQQKQFVKE